MPFRFNMQKVLDYRERMEEEAKVRLGQAESELAKGAAKLANLEQRRAQAISESSGKLMQHGERWLHEQYIKGLDGDVREAAMQLKMLEQVALEARRLLAARAMDRKMLEKLKQRQRANFNKAELKQEQNFNDEIATIRYQAPAF